MKFGTKKIKYNVYETDTKGECVIRNLGTIEIEESLTGFEIGNALKTINEIDKSKDLETLVPCKINADTIEVVEAIYVPYLRLEKVKEPENEK